MESAKETPVETIGTKARFELQGSEVVAEAVDGEVIAINLKNGNYHSLRDGAAVVWEGLIAGRTLEDLLAASADGMDAAKPALVGLVDELCRLGLLRPAGDAAPVAGDAPQATWRAADLRVETFRDMQDLLLLDPVHDVAIESGWPVRR